MPSSGNRQTLHAHAFRARCTETINSSAEIADWLKPHALHAVPETAALESDKPGTESPGCCYSGLHLPNAGPAPLLLCHLPGCLAEPTAPIGTLCRGYLFSSHAKHPKPRAHKGELTFLKWCASFLGALEKYHCPQSWPSSIGKQKCGEHIMTFPKTVFLRFEPRSPSL